MKILLDYFFPITHIEPTPAVATGFLKQALLVVKPATDVPTGVITLCTTYAAVQDLTDNTEAQQLFNAGMNKVYVLPMDDLQLASALEGHGEFFTVLISSDFDDSDIGAPGGETVANVDASLKIQDILYTSKLHGIAGNDITINYNTGGTAGSEVVSVSTHAITVQMEDGVSTAAQIATAIGNYSPANALVATAVDAGDESDKQAVFGSAVTLTGGVDSVNGDGLDVGTFKGVVGLSSTDDDFLADQAATANRAAFHTTSGNKAKNMLFAFGKMLSNALNWRNQQYITMPVADDVSTLGDANAFFDSKINFVINDDEFGKRLGLFAVGGKAIVAPYIIRNLELDMQSAALSYISGNQPAYSKTQAALLEDELKNVIQSYIDREWIEAGVVEVTLDQDNFVASAAINIAEPKALWRIFGEMRQTL
jgi:uncharacterized protein YheU (UPF0270 family)